MESPVDIWRRRAAEPWLAGVPPAALQAAVAARRPHSVRVVLPADDGLAWVAGFIAALVHDGPVDIFAGGAGATTVGATETRILIPTGGTTGQPRHAVHTWRTLSAAARGLQAWLGGAPIHSVCLLPLHHVSGLMQVVRSFASGGALTLADWRAVASGRFPAPAEGAVTSLVPTQLARLLDVPGALEWLRRFRAVFLGGAPAWPGLLARARAARLPVAPCYGMTETAAQVAALPPAEFLAGREGVGQALPHARLALAEVAADGIGRIAVEAESLFRGFLEDGEPAGPSLLTNDLGQLTRDGHLIVLGRADSIIISGGEKIAPAEVEAAIRATGLVADVVVTGVPDAEWGEAVAAVLVPNGVVPEGAVAEALRDRLARHQVPKRWVRVPALPRSEAGKIDRGALRRLLASGADAD